eukprot:GGOE01058911.1.p1 GENE.GGOE01058911.1~~GGOE01058911.1.p1  ORF type:complete len:766 (+),score=277.53 GGOE01058911.1:351-2648(+)
MQGFYRSDYTRADGRKAVLGVTQFEAADARRCFPCWDEPARKAVFDISLVVPADLTAVSNMPLSQLEFLPEGKKRVSFLPSPKMSTYLLAFVVGEFEAVQTVTSGGTLLRVLCTPGRAARCEYALRFAARVLEFYNDFFGVPFPLPKMDMIAVPDFAAGAMENWGLVTYRESMLLCDEATASTSQKQNICACVAHELAHQWFGNLVTMQWWDDLWLNEGFANWMETFSVDRLNPEWKLWEQFVSRDQQGALRVDSLRSSHPIQVPIAHVSEVEEVFDSISYSKGGSIVRLLNAVLGPEHFRAGLQLYFQRHAYGNTETSDLAQAWADASGMPIPQLVKSWTEKMGFPLLRVLKDPFETNGLLEVEQQWFLSDGSVQEGDEAITWIVPLLLGSDTPAVPQAPLMLDARSAQFMVPVESAQWLKLNFGQHVLCRVLYPRSMSQRLSAHLPMLPAEDRIGILSDTFALVKSGQADPTQLVELLRGFRDETNEKVWTQLSQMLLPLDRLMASGLDAEVSAAFRRFAADLVRPCASGLGWDHRPDDHENTKQLRQTVISLLATFCYAEPDVRAEADRRLAMLLGLQLGTVSNDIRCAVMKIAVKNDAGPATYEKLVQLHNKTEDAEYREDIYAALASAAPSLHLRLLEWCLSPSVRSQDMTSVPIYLSRAGREGPEAVFQWTKSQYSRIYSQVGKTSMMLFTDIVRSSGEGFVSAERAAEVKAFWEAQAVYDAVRRTVGQTVETVETNARFVARLRASAVHSEAFWRSVQ